MVVALIVITALALVAPALADPVVTIDNSSATAIADNLSKVDAGGTLILRPGVYREHDLTISRSVTIRADTAHGGSATDTIIDAQSNGRIFNVTDTSTLAIDSLALKNGAVAGESGGAIHSFGDVAISSSVITNCTAQSGGAVSLLGDLTVTASTISGCSSGDLGGAIYSYGNTTLVSSAITDCSAQYGGGLYAAYWGILKSSEISNCTAQSGGAVSAGSGGIIMESSAITGCSAQYGGAIGTDGDVTLTGSSSITNCSASVKGSGINAGGLVTVNSSSIADCSTKGDGGAILAYNSDVSVTSSTITNCSSDNGGAIYTQGDLTVTTSTISGCTSSGGMGGAIYSYGNTTLVSSTVTGCRGAQYGGGIYAAYWGILKSSEISNCTAQSGGAVTAGGGGVIMESSVITGCSAQYGGAIGTDGDVTLTGSSGITNCSASVKGGGINAGGLVTVISSSITDCSTNGDGGAIQVYRSGVSVTSSTIANCSAARGGAVYARSSGPSSIRFSRLVNDSSQGYAVNATSAFAATDNWWGTNSPDFPALVNGPVSYDPWLVMDISAEPSSVTTDRTSTVRVAITNTSAGTDTSAGGIFVPDGIPVAWSYSGVSGSLQPASGSLAGGASTTTFTPWSAGNATVSATVDGETVSVPVTSSGSSGADTSGDAGRGTSFVASSPGTTAGGTMTFAVNEPISAGGVDYAYAVSTVTIVPSGTLGTTELTVTDAGAAANAPDGRTVAGIVAIEPVAVNPAAVSSGTITFAVSGTWLPEHGLAPANIVLMRFHDGAWAELPTTYQYESGGAYYFVATTPGFSYFAIANRISTASADTTAAVTETPDLSSPSVTTLAVPATSPSPAPVNAVPSITSAPVTTATTAVPVGGTTDPSGSSPLATAAITGAGIVAIIGAIWYVRSWWIRRQNPGLFRKYD